ncbi:4Fe-4S dicluster domain-containing protein [Nitratidesulfovibrio termitidis]|uniref:4Fe-4S dicluster domain-containing protein n=1 Tax=Nitratidesulfovibrio termitidis TaxID=42252 RepID=UPI0003F6C699|nr:4Fe-4S dicluster domain-containing protein [Nitratidesulfovibrio termitidis]
MGKMFFIDLTRCTACRGCQIACKQWKNLPAEETRNTGSHQNPPDLSYVTLKTVRFEEGVFDKKLDWLFFPEQCRHCVEPPCKGQADVDLEGAVLKDEQTGAVIFTELTAKVDGEMVRSACPYDIPRRDEATGLLSKCDMCNDRVQNGLLPACVKTCPTGCMNFGDEAAMTELANKRLAEVKKKHPNAVLGDPNDVRVVYLFQRDPKSYFEHAVAELESGPLTRKQLFARLFRARA